MTTETTRTRWPLVALGVSLSAFGAYLQFKLPPILPAFLASYPHDNDVAAGFMSVFALVGLIASAPLGRLLEGCALLQAILAGLVIAAAGIGLGLLAPQSGVLMLVARGLEGITFAIFALIGPVIANLGASRRDLGLVTGLIAAWIPIGQLVAGLLALAGADWHALWFINLLLMLPLAALAFRWRESLGATRQRHSTNGAAAALQRTPRALYIGAGVFTLWSLQFFAFMTWLTKYLTGELQLSAQTAVLAYLLPVVTVMLFNVATGWALSRGLKLLPALVGALLLQVAAWIGAPHASGFDGIVVLLLFGIGAGIAPACFFHLPHHLVKDGFAIGPKAYGVLMTGRNCGVFLGPVVMAHLFQSALGWSGAAYIVAGITAAAALLAMMLSGRSR